MMELVGRRLFWRVRSCGPSIAGRENCEEQCEGDQQMPRLSLNLLVLNGESCLGRMLNSVNGALDELVVVDTLAERKATIIDMSDGFIALPGGIGTLDELAEVLSWAQLGLHAKPVGILDPGDYWGPLLACLDAAVTEGYVLPAHRSALVVASVTEESAI